MWVKRAVLAIVTLVVLVAVGVYAGSEGVRRRTYDVPLGATSATPADPEAIAQGERTAKILGCYGGCHGSRLEGRLFFSEPGVADLVAPNLTEVAASYSDAELERAIRHGIRRDGTGLFVMPSSAFYHLADEDLRNLLAFLRHLPPMPGCAGKPMPAIIDHAAPRVPRGDANDPMARGRYLARIACAECHGDTLQGGFDGRAPTLAIAAAYSDEAFRHLLRTGEPLVERDLYVMDDAARGRFTHFTDEEIAALHTYLRSIPALQAAP
jgi:mono/diheme cytochrome c family protein